MRFLRLPDYLFSILFEDEDIIALDKAYGLNTHTNDSKIEHSEFIQDGLIEMLEKQIGQKLHIIHRLDQTTTGVIIFGKSAESAKKYAEFFFHRQVKKTYWFVTESPSTKPEFLIDQPILHKGKELIASTKLSFLKKSKRFELWQAQPFTGRNHQIRIHARAAGLPLLGDEKYDGASYPFLCLHNRQIEFPNGIRIQARPPIYFEELELLEDFVLARALFETDRRQRLYAEATRSDQCLRLVHSNNFKDPGFSIDQFGKNLILNWHKDSWGELETQRFSRFASLMKKPLWVRALGKQTLLNSGAHPKPEPSWVALENSTQYEINMDSATAPVGLFLNQRLQRDWLRRNSKNKTVLNLFSYTCSFGLAAAIGEATEVISVEANKNSLNWGKRNFALNGLDGDKYKFLCRDSLVYLKQCLSKNQKFDRIICEAPSFFRGEKGVFKIDSGLEMLLKGCLSCLHSQGQLLFSTGSENLFIDDIRKAILKVQKELKHPLLEVDCIQAALDFELPAEKANLKSFLIRWG